MAHTYLPPEIFNQLSSEQKRIWQAGKSALNNNKDGNSQTQRNVGATESNNNNQGNNNNQETNEQQNNDNNNNNNHGTSCNNLPPSARMGNQNCHRDLGMYTSTDRHNIAASNSYKVKYKESTDFATRTKATVDSNADTFCCGKPFASTESLTNVAMWARITKHYLPSKMYQSPPA